MNFKEITDDFVSRPSTLVAFVYTIYNLIFMWGLAFFFDYILLITGQLKRMGGEAVLVCMFITMVISAVIFTSVAIEQFYNIRIKHKILLNPITKSIILPVAAIGLIFFIIPSVVLLIEIIVINAFDAIMSLFNF